MAQFLAEPFHPGLLLGTAGSAASALLVPKPGNESLSVGRGESKLLVRIFGGWHLITALQIILDVCAQIVWYGASQRLERSKSWSYWPGAQQYAAWHKDKQKDKAPDAKPLLTPLDKIKVTEKEKAEPELIQVVSQSVHGAATDTMLKELQSCVNEARKSEAKVKRWISDEQQRMAQWKAYERNVRTEFLAEGARHLKDLDDLDSELSKALETQEAARANVRCSAQGPEEHREPMEQDDEKDPWRSTIAAWEDDPQAVLATALRGMAAPLLRAVKRANQCL